jgi:hypothetical protein
MLELQKRLAREAAREERMPSAHEAAKVMEEEGAAA